MRATFNHCGFHVGLYIGALSESPVVGGIRRESPISAVFGPAILPERLFFFDDFFICLGDILGFGRETTKMLGDQIPA